MRKSRFLIVLVSFLCSIVVPLAAHAAEITVCTFNKEAYRQGEIGYITVTVYNDRDNKIRITELTASVEYYYIDGNVYVQKFYTDATLPVEIEQGTSSSFHIPFSLPTNIAPGYTSFYVKAVTELWGPSERNWVWSDHPTYQPTLYIESPYKQQSEEYQQQLEDQLTTNENTTNMMYLFGGTTLVFAGLAGFLFLLYRRSRFITQPLAHV